MENNKEGKEKCREFIIDIMGLFWTGKVLSSNLKLLYFTKDKRPQSLSNRGLRFFVKIIFKRRIIYDIVVTGERLKYK